MIRWWSANIKITWNADQSNMINDQLITWQNGQIIADHAAWAHVNIVKWPQLAKFRKFRTCNEVLNSGLDPDPESVLKKSWFPSPEFSDQITKWLVDQWSHDNRGSERAVHHIDYIWFARARLGARAAISILWGARGSCDSCREVSCLGPHQHTLPLGQATPPQPLPSVTNFLHWIFPTSTREGILKVRSNHKCPCQESQDEDKEAGDLSTGITGTSRSSKYTNCSTSSEACASKPNVINVVNGSLAPPVVMWSLIN
jgi:hypothetical protein